MKIYFTASTTEKGEYIGQYKLILAYLRSHHALTSGSQIIDKRQLAADARLTQKEIFEREKRRIEASDCVVAEVTKPSTGVGGEIVYALVQNKPVLALVYKDEEELLSPMVAGNPSENLYLEHYDDNNFSFKLKNFFQHAANLKKRNGKLIVIDGGDGSGKTTQAELLLKFLNNKKITVRYYDFPRYYSSFHGKFVGRFLSGEFGMLNQVSPYLASLAYALDRASVREEMDEYLKQGGFIICNRYVTSSMAHQGSRMVKQEQKKFIEWLDELEYKQHKMPRPDLVVYRYVPWKIGLELTAKKAGKRKYIKGLDIAEKDLKHRIESEKMYFFLAKTEKNWLTINCVDKNEKLLSKEEIHKKVVEAIKKYTRLT